MTLGRYDSSEAREFRGQNAVDSMECCLTGAESIKKISSEKIEEHNVKELIKYIKDYTHYRDVAIKYGEDVSRLPRAVHVSKEISDKLDRLRKENKYDLNSGVRIALLGNIEGWPDEAAKDLENMTSGQKCFIISSMYGEEGLKKYEDKLSDALGDRRKDYDFSIKRRDLLDDLEVRRK